MSLKRRILPVRRPKAIGNTDKPLTRVITVSPASRGLRVNVDGCAVLISRDGDSIIVTASMPGRASTVNATEETVSVRILAKGQLP